VLAEELVALVADSPLLLVLAARPEGVARLAEHALRRQPELTTRLTLEALTDESDRALLSALAPGADLPAGLERRVLDRADGNPLYLEELVRALIDAGALVRSDDGWRFDRDVRVHVPETVEKLVLARVDVLSPVARELLAAAAVLGRRFTEPLLARVAGDASALRELLAAELVLEAPRGNELEYRFKHHLIREATYASLLKRRRQELHRRAAEAIEAAFAGRQEERLGVLAHHWEAAGEYERALDYHARAGVAAEAIGAADEALDQYAAACDAAAELGLDAQDPRIADVLSKRAGVFYYTGKPDEGAAQLEAALDGARASGNREAELEVLSHLALQRHGGYANAIALAEQALAIARSLDDPRPQVFALSRLAILDANRLALERALEEGREALEIAQQAEDEELLGLALDGLKLAQLKLGDLDSVARHTAELIQIHERRGDLFYREWALLESSYPLLGAGRLELARKRAGDALALNRRLGDGTNEPLFHDVLCWIARAEGDYPLALEHGRRAVSSARERGTDEWHAWTAATLGWVLLDLRCATDAARLLGVGIEAAREVQATGELLRCTGLLAWARWLLGERERALSLAEEAELMLADVTAPPGEAWLFGAHAQLAIARTWLAAGEPERGAPMARVLLDPAGRNGWRDTAAAAAVVVAGCEDALGRPDAAAEVLEVALSAPGAPAAAWEARLELARLGGPEADRYAAEARDLLERVLAHLGDDPAAAALRAAQLPASAAAPVTKR
jgi:tetratricopeptide (TPR) repeat protein